MGSKYTKENTNKLIETTVFSNKIGRMPLPSKACATFIYDYSPIGYIAGVCEVYALWYDFFLKLLLS